MHRIGRTGRAGLAAAISFAMPDQFELVGNIQKLIRIDIPVSQHPSSYDGFLASGVLLAALRQNHRVENSGSVFGRVVSAEDKNDVFYR